MDVAADPIIEQARKHPVPFILACLWNTDGEQVHGAGVVLSKVLKSRLHTAGQIQIIELCQGLPGGVKLLHSVKLSKAGRSIHIGHNVVVAEQGYVVLPLPAVDAGDILSCLPMVPKEGQAPLQQVVVDVIKVTPNNRSALSPGGDGLQDMEAEAGEIGHAPNRIAFVAGAEAVGGVSHNGDPAYAFL